MAEARRNTSKKASPARGAAVSATAKKAEKPSIKSVNVQINVKAVSYTHLDVYKRQDDGGGKAEDNGTGRNGRRGYGQGRAGPSVLPPFRRGLDPVSYTHLDVYKRQRWCRSFPSSMLFCSFWLCCANCVSCSSNGSMFCLSCSTEIIPSSNNSNCLVRCVLNRSILVSSS